MAKPAAIGARTPAWVITWPPTWTPAASAMASGRNASPVWRGPVPRTSCMYSEAEQEQAEQRGRRGEHHREPAADAAVG